MIKDQKYTADKIKKEKTNKLKGEERNSYLKLYGKKKDTRRKKIPITTKIW